MPPNDHLPAPPPPPHYPEPVLAQPQPLEYGYEMYQGRTLREYVHIFWNRKWWIILTFLGVFLSVRALYPDPRPHLPHRRHPADHRGQPRLQGKC